MNKILNITKNYFLKFTFQYIKLEIKKTWKNTVDFVTVMKLSIVLQTAISFWNTFSMREYPTSEMLLCYSNPEKVHYSSLVFIRYCTSFEFQMKLNLRRKEREYIALFQQRNFVHKKMQKNKEIKNKGINIQREPCLWFIETQG